MASMKAWRVACCSGGVLKPSQKFHVAAMRWGDVLGQPFGEHARACLFLQDDPVTAFSLFNDELDVFQQRGLLGQARIPFESSRPLFHPCDSNANWDAVSGGAIAPCAVLTRFHHCRMGGIGDTTAQSQGSSTSYFVRHESGPANAMWTRGQKGTLVATNECEKRQYENPDAS